MKQYLAIYLGTAASRARWDALPEAEREKRGAAGMAAWHEWALRHAAVIVEEGGPLGRTKRVSAAGVADVRNEMAAWTVVEAESHEAAAKLFVNHPHFTHFPGEAVEVMECLPIPGL